MTEERTQQDTEAIEQQPSAIFQAIGIIVGKVNFGEDGKNTVKIGEWEYPLFPIATKRRALTGLKKEIEKTGNSTQKLVVYPRAIHFPDKETFHQVGFELVGFDNGTHEKTVSLTLKEFEFKLSGLWQFIPACKIPCISVFRNFTPERLEYIKHCDTPVKVRFLKASHLPLLWRESPQPFRYNPRLSKQEQGRPYFVSVKARFMPARNVFGFVDLLAPPQEPPKFLKASKGDKEKAAAEKLKSASVTVKSESPPPKEISESTRIIPKPILKKISDGNQR